MTITFNGKITTEEDEERVFKAFKEFMINNFQNFEFAVSGKTTTLRHKYGK